MKRRKLLLFFLAVIVGLVGWRVQQRLSVKPPAREAETLNVTLQPVARRNLTEELSFSGTLEASRAVPILARVSGKLEEVLFQEGDWVKPGQIVARIETRDYQLRLLEARAARLAAAAELENAGKNFGRMESLFREEVITAQEMDNARARRDAAAAAVERFEVQIKMVQEQLADCLITAPFGGFVSRRFFDPGVFIGAASGPILELVDLAELKVKIPVGETDLARLRLGQPVKIVADAFPDLSVSGRVTRLSPVLDPVTRTAGCEIAIANPGGRFKAGMFVRAEVLVGSHQGVLTISQEALSLQGDNPTVYVVKDGTASLRQVKLGFQSGPLFEVTGGLAEGEKVVISGFGSLYDGAKVEISE
ncbi:MAG TPA: efflux RND transporter periplasmic adaptor subunit [bacterium]|nr:efflux RND transporter periplasmic adaptor subunit [bacterium]